MMKNNKKGIATITIITIIFLILIGIYLILLIPIPSFTKVRTIINYFLIIKLWIFLQGLIIYAYYNVAKYVTMGIRIYKKKVMNWSVNVKNYIITHT
jgi:hypothetical protein